MAAVRDGTGGEAGVQRVLAAVGKVFAGFEQELARDYQASVRCSIGQHGPILRSRPQRSEQVRLFRALFEVVGDPKRPQVREVVQRQHVGLGDGGG